MAYTLVVEKREQRLVFLCDAASPLLLDALWPPIAYNYLLWVGKIQQPAVESSPWDYVIRDKQITFEPLLPSQAEAARLATRKARMLVQLARATNRHRRLPLKEIDGQDLAYRFKYEEAVTYLTNPEPNPSQYPWLTNDASVDGVSLRDSASLIVFRYTQCQDILRYTEHQRRLFTKRILEAGVPALPALERELRDYERKG